MAALVTAMAAVPRPAAGAQGVTSIEVVLGVTSAFSGASAALGTELWRGYAAFFKRVNGAGGINGRRLRLVLTDDAYDPPRAVQNTIGLIEKDGVFILFGNVGTPTTVSVLPLLKKYEDREVSLFAPFTGSQTPREEPYATYVFNVRASYRQETEGLVDRLVGAGYRRLGVLYQSDSYGKSGEDGVRRALRSRGLAISAEATYVRGTRFDASMAEQARILIRGGAEAIVAIGAYEACAAFIRDARDAGFRGPIANISFVGAEAMLARLAALGSSKGKDYTLGLVNSQVVPFHGRDDLPFLREYREAMDGFAETLPAGIGDPKYRPPRYSFGSLEGYLDAAVLVEALRRAGSDLSAAGFRRVMEGLRDWDPGIGEKTTFSPEDHQGLSHIWFTTVSGGAWTPIEDFSSLQLPR